mmetsp:Transcript_16841/g.16094  ORF Transcript_16841/g.16094 Transcript_16841/m.16094 type:complete len:92 (-) Transcript_16841:102-377(-)
MERYSNIMVASTAHDMRTPLNTVLNMHDQIASEITSSKALHWLSISKTSAKSLFSLVNNTLDFFQIKEGQFKFNIQSFSIGEIFRNSLTIV